MIKLLLAALVAALEAFCAYTRSTRARDLARAQTKLLHLQYEITAAASDPSVSDAKLVLLNAEAETLGNYIKFLHTESV